MGRKRVENGVRERFTSDREFSTCMICAKKITGSHLGNLTKHLKRNHPEELEKINQTEQHIEPPRAWIELVVLEGRPFRILNSKSLRKIVKPIFDAMGIVMLTSATVSEEIKGRAAKRRKEITNLLTGKIFSLKIDSATRHRRRIVGINAQLIVNGKIVVKTLSMSELGRPHSAVNIKAYVLSVLQR